MSRSAQDLTDGDMDAIQIALYFIPRLLARASKSTKLLNLMGSKGFKSIFSLNLNGQEGIDAVQISITEYIRVSVAWLLINCALLTCLLWLRSINAGFYH